MRSSYPTIKTIVIILIIGFAFLAVTQAAETDGRKYAPDRKVDILHVIVDVTPNFAERTVEGVTTIKFAPIAMPLKELKLDAIDLAVSSVKSSAGIEDYVATDDDITITFKNPIKPGKETTVTVAYSAEPKEGLYFRTPELGYKAKDIHLFSQGESHEHRHWFPNYDYPNERSTSEVICHVPTDYTVIANGKLVSETIDKKTGLKTVRWVQDKPHVNYLIALVAGKFEKIEGKHRNVPLAFYTTPSNIEYAQNSFRETADIMDFFEKETGVNFPWNKYYQVTTADFVAGGMENTSLTILTEGTLFSDDFENIRSSRSLNSHEMAHQWFGDYVTCKDWSHLWLNEGFATYYEKLHDKHMNGDDAFKYNLYTTARSILRQTSEQRPTVYNLFDNEGEQFDYRNYAKGGWVLHMLRNRLGEDLYRKCVKTYLDKFAFDSTVTEDLIRVIEEVSGRSYDQFFDEWVMQGRFPELKVSYSWSQKDKLAKVSVKQTQEELNNVKVYHFPATIRFIVDGKSIDKQVEIDSEQHDFYFPLNGKAQIVRFDPQYSLLAAIDFDKPTEMLYAQLENEDDVVGRLLAIDQLKKKKDKKTIEKIKYALNNDAFYGVRVQASSALKEIGTDDAMEAIRESRKQSDARVRRQVVSDIAGSYGKENHEILFEVLKTEKNPDIISSCINGLALYQDNNTDKILAKYLKSDSFQNVLAGAAIRTIRRLDDRDFIPALKETIKKREGDLTSRTFTSALDTLAFLAREQEDKREIRLFLTDYVRSDNPLIKVGAISALGTLGDQKARALLQSFTSQRQGGMLAQRSGNDLAGSAQRALTSLDSERTFTPSEVVELRKEIDDMKKDAKELKDELEDLKNKFDAKSETSDPNDSEPAEVIMEPEQDSI